ncbi:hypothetical protein JAAARDRAFT_436867 [Jaapia argillacea MUCL 33604]|uniref:MARVEL domain-containing protein n=1 Tax=Jaapia argillacea MUCL 33604 TaxID=933084 RepID=A0A067PH51_9AGAM|nr:hypothetical protein JAAARDRAFT_436867 [Jaapia argillacea MUCL 33604]
MCFRNPAVNAFLLSFCATILLILTTFSTPFVSPFYFLHSSVDGGVRFGGWGWCMDSGACSSRGLGYHWESQIDHSLTYPLVFYPIAGFAVLATLSLLPILCSRSVRIYPFPAFSLLSLLAAITSFLAFLFSIILFGVASTRFHHGGYKASLGPANWMSLVAMCLWFILSLNSGCGTMCRGAFGGGGPYVTYVYPYY